MSDPRTASARIISGPTDLEGEEIVRVETVELDGEQILVPIALPGASEYRTVFQSELRADELRTQIAGNLDRRGEIPFADVRLAHDFRGAAGTAVTSAAAGLESYANFQMERVLRPDDEVDLDKGPPQSLGQLRALPLNERYSRALPVLLRRQVPTSEVWWSDLRRVQALAALQRHAITESHVRSGLQGKRTLAQRLYGGEYRGAAAVMLAAFEHFTPGWIDDQRRQSLVAAP